MRIAATAVALLALSGGVALAEEPPFSEWIAARQATLEWDLPPLERQLTRETLLASLEVGRRFLIQSQKPEGNFHYTYDWITRLYERSDNQVRQAGAARERVSHP